MVEVKEEYKKSFNVSLADDMRKNYSDNTLKILLGLIKGKLRSGWTADGIGWDRMA